MNGSQNEAVRLYSPALITVATLLGAPVAGCILLAHNYRSLGKQATAKQLLIWGTLGTALLLVVAFFLPENFPNKVIPIAYTAGMHQAVKQLHRKDYESHIENGGAKGSTWKAIITGVGCLCAIFVIIFLVLLVLPGEP